MFRLDRAISRAAVGAFCCAALAYTIPSSAAENGKTRHARAHIVKEDYEERPSNIYRRKLGSAQYARLTAVIRHMSADDKHWKLLFANCNDFAIEVAHGMCAPPSWVMPKDFIAGLPYLNEP